jgi:hypothetical protein
MKRANDAALCWMPALCCLLVAGCGGSGPDLGRVTGEVTLEGQPLQGAEVTFQPTAEGTAPSAGTTDADGRYELMYTFDTKGAVPGEHVVTISTAGTDIDDQGVEVERPERVPAKYNTQTVLRKTVKARSNTIDFDLRSALPSAR